MSSPPIINLNAVRIPQDAERVVDADEEVFILYSELQAKIVPQVSGQPFRGLGHVDSRKNVLSLVIELQGGEIPSDPIESGFQSEKKRTRHKTRNRIAVQRIPNKTVEVDIVQDTTALRTRKGDTGSILWHASVDFARSILQQAHLAVSTSIFDFGKLKDQHIFELGAGTGVLSLLLSSLCRQYTVTDIPELIPLIQKNIDMNFSATSTLTPTHIRTTPLDWIALKNTPQHRRQGFFPIDNAIDLLLIVDCIYHPSLLPPLLETMNYLATPNQTAVLVISELRSEEVIREFLESWLALPGWIIHRIPGLLPGPYVVWIGWKGTEYAESESL